MELLRKVSLFRKEGKYFGEILPSSEVTIGSHNDAGVTEEVPEGMSVSVASPSCQEGGGERRKQ